MMPNINFLFVLRNSKRSKGGSLCKKKMDILEKLYKQEDRKLEFKEKKLETKKSWKYGYF